jgi:hypothetical protein
MILRRSLHNYMTNLPILLALFVIFWVLLAYVMFVVPARLGSWILRKVGVGIGRVGALCGNRVA